MFPILLATYGAVFLAEIVGDKLLYTTGVLATRYRTVPIMCGMALAFMAKMAVAVLIGEAISKLPPWIVATVTAVNFFAIAFVMWRRRGPESEGKKEDRPFSKAALVSFAAIFFSEWGDVGQITAATMAAQYKAPLIVWIGAVSAMVTKGILAASIGAGLRQWIRDKVSPSVFRYAGVCLLVILGSLSVIETLSGER